MQPKNIKKRRQAVARPGTIMGDRRTKRQRDRGSQKRAAIRESM